MQEVVGSSSIDGPACCCGGSAGYRGYLAVVRIKIYWMLFARHVRGCAGSSDIRGCYCARSSDVRMRAQCVDGCVSVRKSYTHVHPNACVRVKVKVMILLECSDLFPTDASARVKRFLNRRW